jgi:hypothetical protein
MELARTSALRYQTAVLKMLVDVIITYAKRDGGQVRDQWKAGQCDIEHQPDEAMFKKWGIDPKSVIICRRRRIRRQRVWQVEVSGKRRQHEK